MLNKEWEDFFGIEELSGMEEDSTSLFEFSGVKKDAASALASCINELGCVNLVWMQDAAGLSLAELTEALEGAIFQDPEAYDLEQEEDQNWVLRPQYLSGNIKTKLEAAKDLNKKYHGRFDANVAALKAAMPEKVDFDAIGFSLGSPWIPETYYSQFAAELLRLYVLPEIHYYSSLGRWRVVIPAMAKDIVMNQHVYGTKRLSALQILEKTLNGSTIKIYDEVSRPNTKSGVARVLNKVETLAAQEKQEILQEEFQSWVRKDPSRIRRLREIFYDTYACNVTGRYSGAFLNLPDLASEEFTPYPHQKDAVARIILEKDVLLNHKVGTGKTAILIMGVHERKRIGLSEKNLIIVPNNVLEAFERTHQKLYPEDAVLVIHPEDFRPDNRQKSLRKIRDKDYTAVYMAFSSFEQLGMSRRFKLDQQEGRIRACRAKAANTLEAWERARLDSMASRLKKELEKMRKEIPKDEYLTFDQLGITTLVVDEIHNFKNVSIDTHADGVVGMHKKGSKKCDDMLEKVKYVRNTGGGIIFSTGTPLTNSISDLFVLQMFLQPEQLELLRLNHFDDWISSFASRQTGFEIDVDSRNYRIRTRFSSFHNIPELSSLFAGVCDFYSNDDAEDLPESEGYTDVIVKRSVEQDLYVDDLVQRTENIRQRRVVGREDNLLKVTHDGRACALDIRLIESEADPDVRSTKVYACAQKVYQLWESRPGTAQLVFCDLGTPKKGFNIYDELKMILKGMGIPDRQIAFVHDAATDAKRRKLFQAVNDASVRVLIGSTSKLGTGVNVQRNLVAVHHLDIPWKPSDMVQREGRLIRQGNRNKKVYRFRYITEGTFDAYSWQLLENKQRFISQFMSNNLVDRETRDLDDTVLTYAEIKALSVGDPLMKTRIDTSNQLERLKIQCRQRDQELRKMEHIVQTLPDTLKKLTEKKAHLEQDHQQFHSHHENLNKAERDAFGEELLEALKENFFKDEDRLFEGLHGFSVLLPAHMNLDHPHVVIQGVSGNRYEVDMKEAKTGGCVTRIDNVLSKLGASIQTVEEEIARARAQAENARIEIRKGNRYTDQVARLSEQLLDIDEELERRADESAA